MAGWTVGARFGRVGRRLARRLSEELSALTSHGGGTSSASDWSETQCLIFSALRRRSGCPERLQASQSTVYRSDPRRAGVEALSRWRRGTRMTGSPKRD